MTTIKLKNGSGAPLAGDLVQGEPALDLTNKRLYTEDSGGTVIEVGTNPSTINIDAGTIDGTVIGGSTAAAGSFTTFTSTGIDDNAASTAITIDGSQNVGIGTSSPSATLALDKNTTSQHRALDLENNSITYSMYVDQDNSITNSWSLFDATNSQTALRYLPSSSGYWQFYTNNTERMRIDSSGNVGIGISAPDSVLEANITTSGSGANNNTAGSSIGIGSSGTTQPIIGMRWTGNAQVGISGAQFVTQIVNDTVNSNALEIYSTGASPVVLGTNSTERMRILPSGGITFNGDTAQANALDDYEEGTWTPALNGFTGSWSVQLGRYTKIGNMVYATFHLQPISTGGSGALIITGLPFTSAVVANNYGSVTSLHCSGWSTTTKPDGALINPNTTNAPLYRSEGQVGILTPQISDLGTGNILGIFVYEAT